MHAVGYVPKLQKRTKPLSQWKPRAKATKKAEQCNIELIEVCKSLLSDENPITVRRLHYLLVSDERARALGYKNTQKMYMNLGRITARARKAKQISPACFVDETRTTIKQAGWHSLSDFAEAYSDGFDLDMWQNQPRMVEVIVEKDGLLSVLGPICAQQGVYLRSSHGQTSITQAYEVAKRFSLSPGKIHTVLYGGDHDPSGYNIEDQAKAKIQDYAKFWFHVDLEIDWRRWALLEDDFEKHGIVSIESKTKDNNKSAFIARFGNDAQFAEIDSLPTQELIDRVTAAIENCKDPAIWQEDLDQQSEDAARLKDVMAQLM
jgi:hypothetical protein